MSTILGIGCDLVEIARMRQALSRTQGFAQRILTQEEQMAAQQFAHPEQFIAGRFAAKEALAKALGCGIGTSFSWHDASIINDAQGKPLVLWSELLLSRFLITQTFLSISHTEQTAIAYALICTSQTT